MTSVATIVEEIQARKIGTAAIHKVHVLGVYRIDKCGEISLINDYIYFMKDEYKRGGVTIVRGDSLDYYERWESPVVIMSDGPYGLGSFPGDPPTPFQLDSWYEPHIEVMWFGSHLVDCVPQQ